MIHIQAGMIVDLLAKKHGEDIFCTELNTTGVGYSGVRRMDAFAMNYSYYNQTLICYEIKVSRGDFLHDKKMHEYLPFCNQFYVVAPPGVVLDKSEVPSDAGYMRVVADGKKLVTVKKAPYRVVDIPKDFWTSLIFKVARNIAWMPIKKLRDITEDKIDISELGYTVGRKIQHIKADLEKRERHVAVAEENLIILENEIARVFGIKVNRHDYQRLPAFNNGGIMSSLIQRSQILSDLIYQSGSLSKQLIQASELLSSVSSELEDIQNRNNANVFCGVSP